ncbi:TadE/TadG family type IV pilus assembly protein [uncultured Sphingomonas sp.]|uniref:TadE/TadG family type IV pilus assembly protein n=1 Tax=uncultured Sphingomonas sp. TaxID=158754 RepID=UPI0025D50C22|nr:TadE/TadG family type IV pilus assembly protein [uncultured Sphingomonas sp.]
MTAHTLAGDQRGVALIEFALTLPLLLLVGLGGIEVARYVQMVLRMNQIAQTVADNAARVRNAMDETDVNEVMIGGKLMGGDDFAANGRIILSDLEQRTTKANGTSDFAQWIRWQRCAGALNMASSYGVPRNSSGGAVTNLDSTVNTDHGAVESASTITGMGPGDAQIAASGGTAVMVAEIFYAYRPLVPFFTFGPQTLRAVEAFNVRQRTDYSVYNGNKVSGDGRSDCRLFKAGIPTG